MIRKNLNLNRYDPHQLVSFLVSLWTVYNMTCRTGICSIHHPLELYYMNRFRKHNLKSLIHDLTKPNFCRRHTYEYYNKRYIHRIRYPYPYICELGKLSYLIPFICLIESHLSTKTIRYLILFALLLSSINLNATIYLVPLVVHLLGHQPTTVVIVMLTISYLYVVLENRVYRSDHCHCLAS